MRESLRTAAAIALSLFLAYGVLRLVGWVLGFVVEFTLNLAFLILLGIVAVPIYLVLRKKVF
ncbi:MAG: hypothetical protein NZ960_05325 [Candidatus Kapabacteria bacterium]|nr:hypothetical protein [Candidatus Kapabacteria bacterium]MDW8012635.1 hypothetical protein [Bacteroidota bacterium]